MPKIQAHVDVPSIYINVDDLPTPEARPHAIPPTIQQPQQPQQPQRGGPFDRFRIVRTDVKASKRIVGRRETSGHRQNQRRSSTS